ncbi:MAG TPA: inorganic phosphate transporter [Prevotella sp.]
MELIYLCIVVFLGLLAVSGLFVGVSNDAVNFLNSAIGARVAKFRTIITIASIGVLVGALVSNGMMDIARHGIMNPANYSYREVMIIFLAVMVTNVLVLDMFNSMGLPTSTTISLVFGLFGGTFVLALLKMGADSTLTFAELMNTEKVLSVIIAIFVSVAIAFVFGFVVQWITRLVFTFNYPKHLRYTVALFGGIAFTALAYFIFTSAMSGASFISPAVRTWVSAHLVQLMGATFVGSTLLMEVLHLCKVNIFRLVVLAGTFALAMAFAGNDLVNFIGVPLAGLSSYQDYAAQGGGANDSFMMHSLLSSAATPMPYLIVSAVLMILAMTTSKKAQNVIKTSIDLARQDEGDNMFGTSRAARNIVRSAQTLVNNIKLITPRPAKVWINSRFNSAEAHLREGAAFDEIRAAINIVLAAMLIIIGTNYKLPLSTTYVTFMVAMGSSLADRAWGRESAVFRITGVMSVIGGWFVTAGVAFLISAVVAVAMFYGHFIAMFAFMILVAYMLIRSNRKFKERDTSGKEEELFKLMLRSKDPEIVWDLLNKHVSRTQAYVTRFAMEQYNGIIDGLANNKVSYLRGVQGALKEEQELLKKYRKKELLVMHRVPQEQALERNTWFHLSANSAQQYVYCLKRMLEPVKEHVDNNFNPLPKEYINEFMSLHEEIDSLLERTEDFISTGRYNGYRDVMAEADNCKNNLSALRKIHIDRMQRDSNPANLQISIVYLNIIQESQQLLSIMRHQLRGMKKFTE